MHKKIFSFLYQENGLLTTLLIIFILNTLAMSFVYQSYVCEPNLLENIRNSPIYQAFAQPTYIFVGIIVNMSTSAPTASDIFLDFLSDRNNHKMIQNKKKYHNSLIERTLILVLNVTTGSIILARRDNPNIAFIYTWIHNLQFFGSMGIVLATCHRLVPKYFTSNYMVVSFLLLAIIALSNMIGFGQAAYEWTYILAIICSGLFTIIFFALVLIPWLMDLRKRMVNESHELTIDELSCLWYSLTTAVILIGLHGLLSLSTLFNYTQYSEVSVCIFVYTFALFTVIISSVPGRLASAAADKDRQCVIEIKGSLIRYMSHEVRSPLNVIYAGLKYMVSDMNKLLPSAEKESLLETLSLVQQASNDLLTTMDDIMRLENIDSGTFAVEPTIITCTDLSDMVNQCGLVAVEKGVVITVNNQCMPKSVHWDDDTSVEVASIADLERTPQAQDIIPSGASLFVDSHKIKQVLRNLIFNAVKFTAKGSSICVNVRPATAEEVRDGSGPVEKAGWMAEQVTSRGYTLACHLLVEVVDRGVGFTRENLLKIFNNGNQFNAQELQGGGGTALGLWVSQEIVKMHGSKLHFKISDSDKETTFYFLLPAYKPLSSSTLSDIESGRLLVNVVQETVHQRPSSFVITPKSRRISPQMVEHKTSEKPKNQDVGLGQDINRINRRFLRSRGVCRVLIVDDSPLNVKMMSRHIQSVQRFHPDLFMDDPFEMDVTYNAEEPSLERINIEIVEADDGTSALLQFGTAGKTGKPFDVVFMDNIMIRMHGPEAAIAMRTIGYEGLIVGVTGNVMAHDVSQYLDSGADFILSKPVKLEELVAVFRRLRALPQEAYNYADYCI